MALSLSWVTIGVIAVLLYTVYRNVYLYNLQKV
jgi:hypothetical protein